MKKLLSILLALTIASSSFAETTADEKAIELMKLLEIRKNIDASMEQVIAFSERMIESQNLDPKVEAMAKTSIRSSMQATLEAMNNIEWEAMFAEIYTAVFTADEIQGLIDFYHTPLGQKLLKKQPELMAATMQKMQGELGKFMPKIQAAAQNAIQQAIAEGIAAEDQE